jgi:AbrB family looped-hinge helix DNA binding protein
MTAILTLDKAGRLVLPKPMREKLHLREGAKLKAEIVGDKIELEQEMPEVKIVRKKGGRRVVAGWTGFDAAKAVRDMRKDQMERLLAPFEK